MKICKDTVRAAMDEMLGDVALSDWDKQRILHVARAGVRHRAAGGWMRRVCALGVTFAVCMALSLGVLASVPGLAQKLSTLSHQTLEYLRPVEESCTVADISMEVVAAMNDGNTAVIYVRLQDLSGQNRLDADTWFNSVMLDGLDSTFCDGTILQSDGSLLLRLTGECDNGTAAGRKITLELESLLLGNDYQSMVDTGYTVADIMEANPTPRLSGSFSSESGYSIAGEMNGPMVRRVESGSMQMLKAVGEAPLNEECTWIKVLNAGVVDGSLHVLIDPDNDQWYNTVEFVLGDAAGNPYETERGVFGRGETYNAGTFHAYRDQEEQVLMLPEDVDPADMHVYYSVNAYDTCLDDTWSVTFTLQEAVADISLQCDDLPLSCWTLQNLAVSPICVTASGLGELQAADYTPSIRLTLADGTTLGEYGSFLSTVLPNESDPDGQDTVVYKYFFDELLDVDQVQQITVDGHVIWTRP